METNIVKILSKFFQKLTNSTIYQYCGLYDLYTSAVIYIVNVVPEWSTWLDDTLRSESTHYETFLRLIRKYVDHISSFRFFQQVGTSWQQTDHVYSTTLHIEHANTSLVFLWRVGIISDRQTTFVRYLRESRVWSSSYANELDSRTARCWTEGHSNPFYVLWESLFLSCFQIVSGPIFYLLC